MLSDTQIGPISILILPPICILWDRLGIIPICDLMMIILLLPMPKVVEISRSHPNLKPNLYLQIGSSSQIGDLKFRLGPRAQSGQFQYFWKHYPVCHITLYVDTFLIRYHPLCFGNLECFICIKIFDCHH